jgi:hypothetical protein
MRARIPSAPASRPRLRLAKRRLLRHQWPVPMDVERDGNLIEAAIWFLLALVLAIYALRRERRLRSTLFLIAVTLAVFGGSDLVEARTGAWWKPWWLLVWKAVCVFVLLLGFVRYYRLMKRAGEDGTTDERR